MSKAPLPGFVRLFWAAVFALMGLCALSWWFLMPSGFGLAHPRFWSHGVLPWLWIAIASLGCYASIGAPALLQWLAFAPPAGLISALLALRLLHPVTASGLLSWVPAIFAVGRGAVAWATARAKPMSKWQLLPGVAFIGLGAWLPIRLRAPPASTQPLGGARRRAGCQVKKPPTIYDVTK